MSDRDSRPRPTPAQLAWQDCEVGILYHFDMPVAAGVEAPNNAVRDVLDPALYDPAQLNTDQWLEAARAAGARYAIFTATHFNGFMQWQSDLYPYGVKQARWRDGKGDVVGDFVESCRRAGIAPGLYFSTHRNAYWQVWGHYADWGEGCGTERQRRFNRIAEAMTEELCSRYGSLVQIWYDAGVMTPQEGGPDVLPVFQRHQPDSVFYHSRQRADHRWIGNEAGHAGDPCWATMPAAPGERSHNSERWKTCLYNGDPAGAAWSPAMVDVPLRGAHGVHNWFWRPGEDHACYTSKALVEMYCRSVGRNSNLILGEVVDPRGLVPESDLEHLRAFGRAIQRRFGEPVGQTEGEGRRVELALTRPARIDHVDIMERIEDGERIRSWVVLGSVGGGEWQRLCSGSSVGHRRIERFESVEVDRVAVEVIAASVPPRIRRLAAYAAG